MKSVVEQGFFLHEFAFDNKALKTFVEFRICWKRSKFECCRIRIRTSSHPYFRASGTRVWYIACRCICAHWCVCRKAIPPRTVMCFVHRDRTHRAIFYFAMVRFSSSLSYRVSPGAVRLPLVTQLRLKKKLKEAGLIETWYTYVYFRSVVFISFLIFFLLFKLFAFIHFLYI